jgi:polar amino acid transport system permease protein
MTQLGLMELLNPLLDGAQVTAEITAYSIVLALIVAFVMGIARLSRHRPVRWLAGTYVEVFRGTSVLVQMFWFFFALPAFGVRLTPMAAAVLALGLNVGAYGAEIVRGAIKAVPPGQIEAAIALNMRPMLRMRRVVVPQALVAMLPPFGNLMIELLKGTALVSLITLSDLTFQAQVLRSSTGRTLAVFSLTLLLYFLMALVITGAVRLLERRVSRGLDIGRGAGSLAEPI